MDRRFCIGLFEFPTTTRRGVVLESLCQQIREQRFQSALFEELFGQQIMAAGVESSQDALVVEGQA